MLGWVTFILGVFMLSVVMPSVVMLECRGAVFRRSLRYFADGNAANYAGVNGP